MDDLLVVGQTLLRPQQLEPPFRERFSRRRTINVMNVLHPLTQRVDRCCQFGVALSVIKINKQKKLMAGDSGRHVKFQRLHGFSLLGVLW